MARVRESGKLLYTVEEAGELLSLSRAQIFRLIDLEELGSVKIGKARRISAAQLDAFVRMLEQTSGFVRFPR
jgi:excisionase family DNA binding protein